MGKLLDEISAKKKDFISVYELINLLSENTDSPIDEVITYLISNKIDENLIVYFMDEYYNFEPSNDPRTYNGYYPDTISALRSDKDAKHSYFKIADLKRYEPIAKWIVFSLLEKNEDELLVDAYGRRYDPQHYINNRYDEYLSVGQACNYISDEIEMQFTDRDLKQLSRHRNLTPCFYFRGYVGTFGSFSTNTDGLYTELLSGYFSFRNLAEYVDGGFEKPKVPQGDLRDGVIIFRILEKQTAEYADGDDGVFLFTRKPIGLADADEVALKEIPVSEIRFSKAEIDRFLASSQPQTDNEYSSITDSLQSENARLKARIADLESQLNKVQSSPPKRSYTTPAIEAMEAVIIEFWQDYDPDTPAPKQDTIKQWLITNFETVNSDALATAIDKICRHPTAKTGGQFKQK